MEIWELIAREQIRHTIASYNHAGDRGRAEMLAQQFTPDGVLVESDAGEFHGRAAIEAFIAGVTSSHLPAATGPSRPTMIRHHVSSLLISDLTPTGANAASYFAVIGHDGTDHWGTYRDVLVPVGDRWLIARRSVRVEGAVPGGIEAAFAEGLRSI